METIANIGNNKIINIDGNNFSNIEEFYNEVVNKFSLPNWFGRNLDAFNDMLSELTMEHIVIWENSNKSKKELNYIKNNETLFNILIEIINNHVQLILK